MVLKHKMHDLLRIDLCMLWQLRDPPGPGSLHHGKVYGRPGAPQT